METSPLASLPSDTVECYNLKKNEWTLVTNMMEPHYGHAGAVHGDLMYISGEQTRRHKFGLCRQLHDILRVCRQDAFARIVIKVTRQWKRRSARIFVPKSNKTDAAAASMPVPEMSHMTVCDSASSVVQACFCSAKFTRRGL